MLGAYTQRVEIIIGVRKKERTCNSLSRPAPGSFVPACKLYIIRSRLFSYIARAAFPWESGGGKEKRVSLRLPEDVRRRQKQRRAAVKSQNFACPTMEANFARRVGKKSRTYANPLGPLARAHHCYCHHISNGT
jgi:hypothetical protein